MGWRSATWMALVVVGTANQVRAADSGIPYRQDDASLGMQAGLAFGAVLLLLALAVGGMLVLRKRLSARLPGALASDAGLRSVASLRLPRQTLVHVVAYRDKEILFVQSGEKLLPLGEFVRGVDSMERGA